MESDGEIDNIFKVNLLEVICKFDKSYIRIIIKIWKVSDQVSISTEFYHAGIDAMKYIWWWILPLQSGYSGYGSVPGIFFLIYREKFEKSGFFKKNWD